VRIRWGVIVGFGLWSVFVWSTRLVNIWRDLLLSTDEKVVLSVMALVFVVLGLAVALIGIGLRKWVPTRVDVIAVGVLGGWTCGVWALRLLDIITSGDHSGPFILVHTALAAVSIALAAWSWTQIAAARPVLEEAPAAEVPAAEVVPSEPSEAPAAPASSWPSEGEQ
jgi:hypothetical protein